MNLVETGGGRQKDYAFTVFDGVEKSHIDLFESENDIYESRRSVVALNKHDLDAYQPVLDAPCFGIANEEAPQFGIANFNQEKEEENKMNSDAVDDNYIDSMISNSY